MVDLGQKGWNSIPPFSFYKKAIKKPERIRNDSFGFFCKRYLYFAAAKRFATSAQLITLKKASI